jgi:endonuclease-8
MPEGPEIRRAADKVAAVLVGREIESISFRLPQLQRYERRLRGHTVTAVDTRGKAMLTRFDNGLTIYSHNQLYGRWYTVRMPRMPQTKRQLRLELVTSTHKALLYSASDIDVLREDQLAKHPFLGRVGPDILDRKLTKQTIVERLCDPQFRNRALGSLYLDQGFLAGNGNYLRSEILWASGLAPARKPASLTGAELEKLARQTLQIARRSYRTRGVSFEQYRFYVFGREGLSCHRCGSWVERHTMGSRNLFTCPACQPADQFAAVPT